MAFRINKSPIRTLHAIGRHPVLADWYQLRGLPQARGVHEDVAARWIERNARPIRAADRRWEYQRWLNVERRKWSAMFQLVERRQAIRVRLRGHAGHFFARHP